MSRYLWYVLILLCAGMFSVLSAQNEDKPAVDETYVKELIEKLGSQEKEVWYSVVKELVDLGEPAVPFLEKALKSSNKSLSRRAKILLRKINKRKLARSFVASTITAHIKEQPVSKVLEVIETQTGNKIPCANFNDKPITIDFKETSFWETLDTVAELSGNIYGIDPIETRG